MPDEKVNNFGAKFLILADQTEPAELAPVLVFLAPADVQVMVGTGEILWLSPVGRMANVKICVPK